LERFGKDRLNQCCREDVVGDTQYQIIIIIFFKMEVAQNQVAEGFGKKISPGLNVQRNIH